MGNDDPLVSLYKSMQVGCAFTAFLIFYQNALSLIADFFRRGFKSESMMLQFGICGLWLMILLGNGWASSVYVIADMNPLSFGPTPIPLRFVLLSGYQVFGAAFLCGSKEGYDKYAAFILYLVLAVAWYGLAMGLGFPHIPQAKPGLG